MNGYLIPSISMDSPNDWKVFGTPQTSAHIVDFRMNGAGGMVAFLKMLAYCSK